MQEFSQPITAADVHMAQLLQCSQITEVSPTYMSAKAGPRLKGKLIDTSHSGCYSSMDVDNFNISKRAVVIGQQ